jgi:hypothetical protein
MPDERPSITKKLHIKCANEEEQLQGKVDKLREKLLKIRNVMASGNKAEYPAEFPFPQIRQILDEPERPPIEIEDVKVYIQVGLYPDTGQPGEIFLKSDRMGSTISGLLDALSMSISVALQSGVPLQWFVEKLKNMQFVPAGPTSDPKIKQATSIVDGLAKWLEYRFPPSENLDKKEDAP